MKKWMKNKLLTIITVIIVAGIGAGSLLNASKLESLFNPGKFKKFENRYHSDNYDYAAGDGDDMNLADEDKEGKGKDEDQQQVLPVSEPEEKKGTNTLGIANDKKTSKSNKKNGVELADSKGDSSKNKRPSGTNPNGRTNPNDGSNTKHNTNTGGGDNNRDNPSDQPDNSTDNTSNTGNKKDTDNNPGHDDNSSNGNDPTDSDNPSDEDSNNNNNNNNNKSDDSGNNKSDDNTSSKPDKDNTGSDDNKTSWEDKQLKPKDPVETADGKLTLLTVAMKKSRYTRGESFSAEDADVTATFEKDGKKTDKVLSYGGSDGYSVTLSTKKTGDQTAIFSYKGTTVRAAYEVVSNYVMIFYEAAYGNTSDCYTSKYPGVPLGNIDADSYSALQKEASYPNNGVISGNIINLATIHKKMIAQLGDASVKSAFGSYSGENYPTTVFLSEDSEGYLTTMLEGFRYVYNRKIMDSRAYVYYPYNDSWDTTGRNVVDTMSEVPSGYKIRRVTSNEGNLEKYSADQVLEGYTGSDTTITVPMGVTKVAFKAKAAKVTKLSIPQSVSTIDTKSIADNLPDLTDYVAADSEKEMALAGYKIIDGVLYSTDGKTLLSVPAGKKNVNIPGTVTRLAKDCFRGMSKDAVITFCSQKAPAIEGETGYVGMIKVPVSDYNTVYKRYMFAFGKEANSMTFSDTKEQKDLYTYKEADTTLRYKAEDSRLAAIAPGTSGEYTVSKDVNSIGSGAFVDCKRLTDVTMDSQVTELCENSLVLQDGMDTVTLKAQKMKIADKLFGDPSDGCNVPEITVHVGSAVYEEYLQSWTEILDPVYGADTAKKLLYGQAIQYLYEDGVKYQKLTSGNKEEYRLVSVYQKDTTAVQVKAGTVAVSSRAFSDCTSLEILSLPDTLTDIPEGLFTDCTALETVLCDSAKTEVAGTSGIADSTDVYRAGEDYTSFEYEDGVIYGKNTAGERSLLNVPTDYEGTFNLKKNTVILGKEAFKDCGEGIEDFILLDITSVREIGDRCFENSAFVRYFDLRSSTSLTKVGEEAFKDCHNLQQILIPDSLKTISKQMFYNDDALVNIEASLVTTIEDEAFYGCDSLEGVKIDKVETMGDYAFYSCRMIQSIILPKTLTSLGESCFENCTLLRKVEINGDIPGIPRYCFYGCRALTNVSLHSEAGASENSLRVIGAYAFSQCSTLDKLDFSDSHNLSQIGEAAFAYDISLVNVKLPDSLQKMNKNCFEGCKSLSILQLNSESVTQPGEKIFGDDLLEYVNIWVKEAALSDYVAAYKEVLDPEYGEGTAEKLFGVINDHVEVIKGVEFEITEEGRILKHASKDLSGDYVVPEDTIAIADEAFMDCTKLTGVTLPRGASIRLGDRCFKNCTGLLKIEIYSAIPEWGEETFMNCTSAQQVNIGASNSDPVIERIGTRAFKGCTGLGKSSAVRMVVGVRVLGEECLADCVNLTDIGVSTEFRANLEVIEDKALNNCKSLNTFLASSYKGLKSIGAYAFENCDTLKQPSVPENVTSIGEGCFRNCDNLQYVSIYGAVEEYPKDCFKNCPKLLRTGGTAKAFAALKRIGESAYEGCTSIVSSASWSIGRYRNLETIGVNAFKDCKSIATGVVVNSDIKAYIYTTQLAASVTSIGAHAFDGCSGMSNLIFQSATPPSIGSMDLSSMAAGFEMDVPDSKENGDNIYKAYLEELTKTLGEEKAYVVLDSISDGARERYKEEKDKEQEPDAASEKATEEKADSGSEKAADSTEKSGESSENTEATSSDKKETTGKSEDTSADKKETTEKSEDTSADKKETTEKSEDTSADKKETTEKSENASADKKETTEKSEDTSAGKEKTSGTSASTEKSSKGTDKSVKSSEQAKASAEYAKSSTQVQTEAEKGKEE